MANEVFGRVYQLQIGRNKKLIKRSIPSTIIRPGGFEPTLSPAGAGANLEDGSYSDYLVVPGKSVEINSVRIVANITETKESKSPSTQDTTIELYNLSKETQNSIASEDTVLLRAGYEQDGDPLPLVFAGQIVSTQTIKKGQDTITKLVCKSIAVPRNNVRVSKIYPKDSTILTIVEDLAEVAASNGIPTGNIFIPVEIPYPSGYTVAGNLMEILTDLCSRNNLRCYISLGRLYVEPIDVSPDVETVFIEPENVKDSIRPEDDASGKTSNSLDKASGISFITFLNGRLNIAKLAKINFGEYEGTYRIISVNHKMDLRGDKWDTIVSCRRLK